ncbi:MAG: hypothetical protein KKA73_07870 [Chloroflexi bacterium]|nr:hypothetical protein [Chloroflexota bacterium]MBU1747590.1 hypothetical protein [Chloroflexota bacterium]
MNAKQWQELTELVLAGLLASGTVDKDHCLTNIQQQMVETGLIYEHQELVALATTAISLVRTAGAKQWHLEQMLLLLVGAEQVALLRRALQEATSSALSAQGYSISPAECDPWTPSEAPAWEI